MYRIILIQVTRDTNSAYATVRICLANKDRTPLLKFRILANDMIDQLGSGDSKIRKLVHGEIVARE